MQTQHLEVIPRIIDESIAANYQKSNSLSAASTKLEDAPAVSMKKTEEILAPTFTQRFFSTLKDYIVPILFILAVIIMVYILWKYFTKYRNRPESKLEETVAPMIEHHASNTSDLSKYIFDTESISDDETKLSTIDEGSKEESNNDSSEDSDEEESESDDEEESESDDEEEPESNDDSSEDSDEEEPEPSDEELDNESNSIPSLITEPDFNTIADLINQPIDAYLSDEKPLDRFEYISADASDNESKQEDESLVDDYALDSSIFTIEPKADKPKSRKSRKSQRIVL